MRAPRRTGGGRHSAVPEADHAHEPDDGGTRHREPRARAEVAGRELRLRRQTVYLRPVDQQEEGIEPPERTVLIGTVEIRVTLAPLVEYLDPLPRTLPELSHGAKLDR